MSITKTAWNWTVDQADEHIYYLVRVLQDKLEWSYQTSDRDRGGYFQTIKEFLRGNQPVEFRPPQNILNELTEFLESGSWKTSQQWETLWVQTIQAETGHVNVLLTHFRGNPEEKLHENVDRAFLDYLMLKLKNDGWRETRRDTKRRYFQRRWQYQDDDEDSPAQA
jgi:hypothetical protein